MDGVDCAKRIYELTRAPRRPPTVMMLTAFSREEVMRRLGEQRVQVAALLTKPVTPSSLFDACCQALGVASAAALQVRRREGGLAEPESRLKGARLLLVEDNEVNRELALELLTDEGISVAVALDGREALEMLERERFDAVLMDCQMPVMDGFAATRALRKRPELAHLPVIAMTANAMVSDRQKAFDAGMNDHIAKPINVAQMFSTLARWLGPRRQSAHAELDDASSQAGPI
jgi:CheY-like chemotaxis protein